MNKLFTLTLLLLGATCKISAMGLNIWQKNLGLGKEISYMMSFEPMECNGEVYEPMLVDEGQWEKWNMSLVMPRDEAILKNYFLLARFTVTNKELAPSRWVRVLYKKKNATLEGLTEIPRKKLEN